MRVCGVEIKNNEVIICLLVKSAGLFDIPDCRVSRIVLQNPTSREHLQNFQKTFSKLMEDYTVKHVVIRERPQKGKFAGSTVGFKLEAAIQLITPLGVEIMSATEIKHLLSENPIPVNFCDTGLKAYQETAFLTAYSNLIKPEIVGSEYYQPHKN